VGRDRTADTRIFSPLLYRLSYRTAFLLTSGRVTGLDWGGKNKYFSFKIEKITPKTLKIGSLAAERLHPILAQELDPHDLELLPGEIAFGQLLLGHLEAAGLAAFEIVDDLTLFVFVEHFVDGVIEV
jgi:hypothetical protein